MYHFIQENDRLSELLTICMKNARGRNRTYEILFSLKISISSISSDNFKYLKNKHESGHQIYQYDAKFSGSVYLIMKIPVEELIDSLEVGLLHEL